VIFAIQPVLTRDRTKAFTEKEDKLLEYQWGHMRIHPTMIQHLADRLAARAAGDPSFHYMDLTDVFRDFAPDAYVDYCHLTPAANHHLAKRIAEYVLARPELAPPAQPATAARGRPAD
jgi:hypothetical protein